MAEGVVTAQTETTSTSQPGAARRDKGWPSADCAGANVLGVAGPLGGQPDPAGTRQPRRQCRRRLPPTPARSAPANQGATRCVGHAARDVAQRVRGCRAVLSWALAPVPPPPGATTARVPLRSPTQDHVAPRRDRVVRRRGRRRPRDRRSARARRPRDRLRSRRARARSRSRRGRHAAASINRSTPGAERYPPSSSRPTACTTISGRPRF